MTLDEARAIIEEHGYEIDDGDLTWNTGGGFIPWLSYSSGQYEISLDGDFNLQLLVALTVWMDAQKNRPR